MTSGTEPAWRAMVLGTMKMPVPSIVPTTIAAAAQGPRTRARSTGVAPLGGAGELVRLMSAVRAWPRFYMRVVWS